MAPTLTLYLLAWPLLAVLLFTLSVMVRRNDIADIAWGPGIATFAWLSVYAANGFSSLTHQIIVGLISIWALRLCVRIFRKNIGRPEDARYRAWRDAWGHWFYLRSFFQVFLLQTGLMIVMASGAAAASMADLSTNGLLVLIGCAVWCVGFAFESIGDYQLDRFLAQPNHPALMTTGLWRYTRHPNYFGEITMWWGLAVLLLGSPVWYLGLIAPLTITYLILFVSGIPMLEKHMSQKPEWATYAARTSALIPLPPKQS